jgi:hypothetical protein
MKYKRSIVAAILVGITISFLGIAALIFNEKPPKEELTTAQQLEKNTKKLEPFLSAVNRTWVVEQSCWDFNSKSLLVKFSNITAKEDEATGWHIFDNSVVNWTELDNGTYVFKGPKDAGNEVFPDISGLICLEGK